MRTLFYTSELTDTSSLYIYVRAHMRTCGRARARELDAVPWEDLVSQGAFVSYNKMYLFYELLSNA